MKIIENLLEIKSFRYVFNENYENHEKFADLLSTPPPDFYILLSKSSKLLQYTHDYPSIIKLLNKIDELLTPFEENLEILLNSTIFLMHRKFVKAIYTSFEKLLDIIRKTENFTIIVKIAYIIEIYIKDEKNFNINENPIYIRYFENFYILYKSLYIVLSDGSIKQRKNRYFMCINNNNIVKKAEISIYNATIEDIYIIEEKVKKLEKTRYFEVLLNSAMISFLLERLLKKENSIYFSFFHKNDSEIEVFKLDLWEKCLNSEISIENRILLIKTQRKLMVYDDNNAKELRYISYMLENLFNKDCEYVRNEDFLLCFLSIIKQNIMNFTKTTTFNENPSLTASYISNLFFQIFRNLPSFMHNSYKIIVKIIDIFEIFLNCEIYIEDYELDSIIIEKITQWFHVENGENGEISINSVKILISFIESLLLLFKDKRKAIISKKLIDSSFIENIAKYLHFYEKSSFFNKLLISLIKVFNGLLEVESNNQGNLILCLEEKGILNEIFNEIYVNSIENAENEAYLTLETLKLTKNIVKYENNSNFLKKYLDIFEKCLTFYLRDELIFVLYQNSLNPKFDSNYSDFSKNLAKEMIEILELMNNLQKKEEFIKLLEKFLDILLSFQGELPEKLTNLDKISRKQALDQYCKLMLNFTIFLSRFFSIKSSFREKIFENLYKKFIFLLKFPYIHEFDDIYNEILLKCYDSMLQLSNEFIYDLSHYLNDLLLTLSIELDSIDISNENSIKTRYFFIKSLILIISKGFHKNLACKTNIEVISMKCLDIYKSLLMNLEEFKENDSFLEFYLIVIKEQRKAYGLNIRGKGVLVRKYIEIMIDILKEFEKNIEKTHFLRKFKHLLVKIKAIYGKDCIGIDFIKGFDEKGGYELVLKILENITKNENLEENEKKCENLQNFDNYMDFLKNRKNSLNLNSGHKNSSFSQNSVQISQNSQNSPNFFQNSQFNPQNFQNSSQFLQNSQNSPYFQNSLNSPNSQFLQNSFQDSQFFNNSRNTPQNHLLSILPHLFFVRILLPSSNSPSLAFLHQQHFNQIYHLLYMKLSSRSKIHSFFIKTLYFLLIKAMKGVLTKQDDDVYNNEKYIQMLTENTKHLKMMGFSENSINSALLQVQTPILEDILIVLSQKECENTGFFIENQKISPVFTNGNELFLENDGIYKIKMIELLIISCKNIHFFNKFIEKPLFLLMNRLISQPIYDSILLILKENMTKEPINPNLYLYYSKILRKSRYFHVSVTLPVYSIPLPVVNYLENLNFSNYIYNILVFLIQNPSFYVKDSMVFLMKILCFYQKNQNFAINSITLQAFLHLIDILFQQSKENIAVFLENQGINMLLKLKREKNEKNTINKGIFELFIQIIEKTLFLEKCFFYKNLNFELFCYFDKNYEESVNLKRFMKDFGKYLEIPLFYEEINRSCALDFHKNRISLIKSREINEIPQSAILFLGYIIEQIIEDFNNTFENIHCEDMQCEDIHIDIQEDKNEEIEENIEKKKIFAHNYHFSFIFLIKSLQILIKNHPFLIEILISYDISCFQHKKTAVSCKRKKTSFLTYFLENIIFYSFNNFNDFIIDCIISYKKTRFSVISQIIAFFHFTLNSMKSCDLPEIHQLITIIPLHIEVIKLKYMSYHRNFIDIYIKLLHFIDFPMYKHKYIQVVLSNILKIFCYIYKKTPFFIKPLCQDFANRYEEEIRHRNLKKTIKIQKNTYSPEILNKQEYIEIQIDRIEEIDDYTEKLAFSNEFPIYYRNFPDFLNISRIFDIESKNSYELCKISSYIVDFSSFQKKYEENKQYFEEIANIYAQEVMYFDRILRYFSYFSGNDGFLFEESTNLPYITVKKPHIFSSYHRKSKKKANDDELITYINPNHVFHQYIIEDDDLESIDDESNKAYLYNFNAPEGYLLEILRDCTFFYEGQQKNILQDIEEEGEYLINDEDICIESSEDSLQGSEEDEELEEFMGFDIYNKEKNLSGKIGKFIDISQFIENIEIYQNKRNLYENNDIYRGYDEKKMVYFEGIIDIYAEGVDNEILRIMAYYIFREDGEFAKFPIDFYICLCENSEILDKIINFIEEFFDINSAEKLDILLNRLNIKEGKTIEDIYKEGKFLIIGKILFLIRYIAKILNFKQISRILSILSIFLQKNNEFNINLALSIIANLMKKVFKSDENIELDLYIDYFMKKMLENDINDSIYKEITDILGSFCEFSAKYTEIIISKVNIAISCKMNEFLHFIKKISLANINQRIIDGIFEKSRKIAIFLNFLSEINSFYDKNKEFWVVLSEFLSNIPVIIALDPIIQAFLPLIKVFLQIYSENIEMDEENDDFFSENNEISDKNEDILCFFLKKNKKLLSAMLKKMENSYIPLETLNLIIEKFPELIDFDIKRRRFNEKLKKMKGISNTNALSISKIYIINA